jgi:hypothetical protein
VTILTSTAVACLRTGHYLPELAQQILNYNEQSTGFKINFKGFAVSMFTDWVVFRVVIMWISDFFLLTVWEWRTHRSRWATRPLMRTRTTWEPRISITTIASSPMTRTSNWRRIATSHTTCQWTTPCATRRVWTLRITLSTSSCGRSTSTTSTVRGVTRLQQQQAVPHSSRCRYSVHLFV